MRRVLTALLIGFVSQASALELRDVKTADQVQQYASERIKGISKAKSLNQKKKMADALMTECLALEQEATIEATSACYTGLRCLGTSYLKFDSNSCKEYVRDCEFYFLGGTGRGENVKITAFKGSAEAYGFQMLAALGCQVPADYLQEREPSSQGKQPAPSNDKKQTK